MSFGTWLCIHSCKGCVLCIFMHKVRTCECKPTSKRVTSSAVTSSSGMTAVSMAFTLKFTASFTWTWGVEPTWCEMRGQHGDGDLLSGLHSL